MPMVFSASSFWLDDHQVSSSLLIFTLLFLNLIPVVGPAELLQGLGTQAQGHPGAGRRGRRQPPGCQGVGPFLMEAAPTLWAGPPRGGRENREKPTQIVA